MWQDSMFRGRSHHKGLLSERIKASSPSSVVMGNQRVRQYPQNENSSISCKCGTPRISRLDGAPLCIVQDVTLLLCQGFTSTVHLWWHFEAFRVLQFHLPQDKEFLQTPNKHQTFSTGLAQAGGSFCPTAPKTHILASF